MKRGLPAGDCEMGEGSGYLSRGKHLAVQHHRFGRQPWAVLLYHLEAQSGTTALGAERTLRVSGLESGLL